MWFTSKLCLFLFIVTVNLGAFVKGDDPKARECYDCLSVGNTTPDCLNNPSKEKLCTSTSGYCFTTLEANGLFVRGCVRQEDPFIKKKEDCENKNGTCILCSDQSMCNVHKLKEEKCYEVKYSISEPISVTDNHIKACSKKSFENLGCYHLEKNDEIKRGCMSDLDEDTQKKYRADDDCEICTTEKCNSKVVRKLNCAQCEKDTNCAEPSELQKTKDCSEKWSSCIVGIDKNGEIHRDCGTTEKQAEAKYKKYDLCYSETCNDQIFPKNRLKCLQCQGDNDCELKTSNSKKKLQPKVCEIYADNDQCYTYYENGGKIYRGCMSDQTNGQKSCQKDDENCQKCDKSGCNDKSGAGNIKVSLLLGITLTAAVVFGLLS